MTTSDMLTVPSSRTRYTGMIVSYMPFDQPPPFSTEPVSVQMFPSFLSLGTDITRPPRNWTLLWRLEQLEQVPESERWPAADWPSDKAFADARTFIDLLPLSSIPLPHVGLADDGEINFLWNHDEIHVDLGFYGAGTFSYFARGKDDKEFYDDDVPAANGLPEALVELLSG